MKFLSTLTVGWAPHIQPKILTTIARGSLIGVVIFNVLSAVGVAIAVVLTDGRGVPLAQHSL